MNKLSYKDAMDEGLAAIHNDGCDGMEMLDLISIFKDLIVKTSAFSASKAWFNLDEVSHACAPCVGHFKLALEKIDHPKREQWVGTFEAKDKYLKLFSLPTRKTF